LVLAGEAGKSGTPASGGGGAPWVQDIFCYQRLHGFVMDIYFLDNASKERLFPVSERAGGK